jgi:hypothetical protein
MENVRFSERYIRQRRYGIDIYLQGKHHWIWAVLRCESMAGNANVAITNGSLGRKELRPHGYALNARVLIGTFPANRSNASRNRS